MERELDDELRAFVELLAEEKMRAGMPPEEARRAARVECGGVEQLKEEVRAVHTGALLESLVRDLRYAVRGLRRSPGFALMSIVCLGLTIGASSIVFTFVERLVLRPLPAVPEAGRVVRLYTRGPAGDRWGVSYPDYVNWREAARSFEDVAAQTTLETSLQVARERVRAWGAATSVNLFDVLRVRPFLGRTFRPEDETTAPTAVISHRLWRTLFRADASVVGRRVELNGHDVTVVGVAPPRFAGPVPGEVVDVWVPAAHYELISCSEGVLVSREWRMFAGFARLAPGVSAEEAGRDLSAVQRRLAATHPESRGTSVRVVPVEGWQAGLWASPLSGALLAVTLVVLLVACANVATLLLARAASRQREIGIRLAVGAGRSRLVRQWLVESGVLALGGGVLGLVLAAGGGELTLPALASGQPIGTEVFLDARVLAYALGLTAAATLLIGLAPALQASNVDLGLALRGGAVEGAAGRRRLESVLVVSQVALSLVSLVCAGLFLRGVQRARAVDIGMRDPQHVLLFDNRLYLAGYTCVTGPALTERMLARVRALPGVNRASVATFVPLGVSPPMMAPGLRTEGDAGVVVESRGVMFGRVGSDYFATVGTPIVRGRAIGPEDDLRAGPVAVVNEAFARRYWPGADPLGRRFDFGGAWFVVVGVARDAKYTRLGGPALPFFYTSIVQSYWSDFALIVRVNGDPGALRERLRRALADLDPRLPVSEGRTLAEHAGAATYDERLGAGTLATTGALALVLCALGLYGLLTYTVVQRTREIGVCVALGAGREDVLRLVVGRAMRLTGIGLAVGIALSFGAARLLRGRFFGVGLPDAGILAAVVALLATVALLAAWLPARRAMRVNPVIALEAE